MMPNLREMMLRAAAELQIYVDWFDETIAELNNTANDAEFVLAYLKRRHEQVSQHLKMVQDATPLED